MKLLTKDVIKRLPPLGSTDGQGEEAVVQVKFFNTMGRGTWFATEASAIVDGEEVELTPESYEEADEVYFHGLVQIHFTELGVFALSELESFEELFGLGIERDRWFEPTSLSEIRKQLA